MSCGSRARGSRALGLNGTPNRQTQILCCEIVFNSPPLHLCIVTFQMFHTPSFSHTFCRGIEFKTLQMYPLPTSPHTCDVMSRKEVLSELSTLVEIHLSETTLPASQSLGVKTILPAMDEHCFLSQSNTTIYKTPMQLPLSQNACGALVQYS